MQESYLQHHGILGMHWGIRRYQNKDGSLTSAGKSRIKTYDKAKKLKMEDFYKFREFKSSNKKEIKEGEKLKIKIAEQDLPFYKRSRARKVKTILHGGVAIGAGIPAATYANASFAMMAMASGPRIGIGFTQALMGVSGVGALMVATPLVATSAIATRNAIVNNKKRKRSREEALKTKIK